MGFQDSLAALAKTFVAFYVGCCLVGRSDVPRKLITELRAKAMAGTAASWACPSAFSKNACNSYDPKRYR